jgi:hypothetical protein
VSFRVIVQGAESRAAGIMTSAETVRGLAAAASGIVSVALAR